MKTERQTYLPISVWDKLPIFTQLTLEETADHNDFKIMLQDPDLLYSSSTNC